MKDIRIDVKFQNNLILSMMESSGIKIVAELARQTGIGHSSLGALINMKRMPFTKSGKWTPHALKLASFFGCLPDDLFSEFQKENALKKNRTYAEISFSEVQELLLERRAALLDPPTLLAAKELRWAIENAFNSIPPREATVLRMHFGFDGQGEKTLEEIAAIFGVSKERIRQIEMRALRKLRHPSLANPILRTVSDGTHEGSQYGGKSKIDKQVTEATAFIDL